MEKVVSRKVLGSANPIARKARGIKSAIQGLGCGVVSLILGIVLIVSSVTSVKENSKTIEATELKTPEMVEDENGYVKIHAIASDIEDVKFTYSIKDKESKIDYDNDYGYDYSFDYYDTDETEIIQETFGDFLYLSAVFERFEVVKEVRTETRTKVENGQDIEETVEITDYNEEWVEKDRQSITPKFSLGSIQINPEKASFKIDTQDKTVANVDIPNLEKVNTYNQIVSDKVGETRLIISYIPNNQEMIVAGDLSGNQISSGDPFIISNKSDEQLVTTLKTEESIARWGLRIGAWLLLTIGFGMLLAPILEIMDIIPFLGGLVKGVAFFISAFVSFLIVLFVTLLVKFWYIALFLIILLLGGLVWVAIKLISKKQTQKEEKSE